MKKWLKIPVALVAAVVALIVAAMALLHLQPVQKAICDKAAKALSGATGMDVSFGNIYFALFDRFILDDVALLSQGDTVVCCGKASLSFSPSALLSGGIAVKRLLLQDGALFLANLPSGSSGGAGAAQNAAEESAEESAGESAAEAAADSAGFSLPQLNASLHHLKISNFRIVTERPDIPEVDRTLCLRKVDPNHVLITGLDFEARDVRYDGGSASLEVDGLSFAEENSGLDFKNLSFGAAYDTAGIHISNFNFNDGFSDFTLPDAHLYFRDFEDFGHFADSVSFSATLSETLLDLTTVQRFANNIPYLELKLIIDGKVEGSLKDIRTDSLKVWSGTKGTYLNLSAHLIGLPDALHTMASIMVNDSYTSTEDIAQIAYECSAGKEKFKRESITRIAPGTRLKFLGSLNGFFEDFVAFGAVESALGGCNVDIMCRTAGKSTYEVLGFADLNDFDIGGFLQSPKLGQATLHASASGTFSTPEKTEYYIDELTIPKFEFNDYTYSNISAAGNWKHNEFEARVVSSDPNLKFMLQGLLAPSAADGGSLYHVKLSLGHADLHALNFDKRDISTVRLNAEATINRTKEGPTVGKVNITGMQCESPDGTFDLPEIEAVAFGGGNRHMAGIKSDMFSARYRGSAPVTGIISQAEASVLCGKLDNLASRMKSVPAAGSDKFDLELKVQDLSPLLGFLAPGVHVERGSTVLLSSPGDSTLTAKISSPLLATGGVYVQDLHAGLDFGRDSSFADITSQMIQSGKLSIADASIKALCAANAVEAGINFCNDPDSLEAGSISTRLFFPDRRQSSDNLQVYLKPSFINIGGNTWNISPSSVFIAKKHIAINGFSLLNEAQGLSIAGVLSDSPADTCTFDIRSLDLSMADLLLASPLNLSGSVSGNGQIITPFSKPDVFADIVADSLSLAGHDIGRLEALSRWDDSLQRVKLLAVNTLDSREVLRAGGYYSPQSGQVQATVSALKFQLGVLEPFLSSLATDISGSFTGNLAVSGPLNALDLAMQEGHLEQLHAKLDYTKVPYVLDGFVDIAGPEIILRDFTLKDEENGSGTLLGRITHNHFKDMALDVRIKATDLLGLNTTKSDNETFYGKAYASGDISITGPVSALALNMDITTRPGSAVNIPIQSASSTQSFILTFKDSKPRMNLSSIDSLIVVNRLKVQQQEVASGGGLSVAARIHATEETRLNLEIGSSSGDALHVNGSGVVDLAVKDGAFSILGDYAISEGDYDLTLLGLVNRKFSLNPGSTIHFTGDIMDSELDMAAVYKTKVSISPLISSDGESSSMRRPVNCSILAGGKLSNPSLSFDIGIEDLDPTVEATISNTLNTEEKRMRQFLALIVSGSFIPDEQSGIVNNTSVSYFNATEIMSNQLNGILQQLGIPIDFGFNYLPTETGRDIFDVAVSTQLINNRVTVNGNIGNRRYMTSNRDDIVGDIDVNIKLGRRGKTKLKLFSHSADEYSNYLDQTQRNGVGISYKQEFNKLRDLFRRSGKERKSKN